MNNHTMAIIRR